MNNKALIWALVMVMLAITVFAACNQTEGGSCVRNYDTIINFPAGESWGLNETLDLKLWVASCSQAWWNRGGLTYGYANPQNSLEIVNSLLGYCTGSCRASHLDGFEYQLVNAWWNARPNNAYEYIRTGVSTAGYTTLDSLIAAGIVPIFNEMPNQPWYNAVIGYSSYDYIRTNCENVSVQVILYYGDSNEQGVYWGYIPGTQTWVPLFQYSYQPNWQVEQSPGPQVVQFVSYGYDYNGIFHLNKSGTYQMKVFIKGQNDPSVTVFTKEFTVAVGGAKAGSGSSSGGGLSWGASNSGFQNYNDTDAINKLLDSFKSSFGYWTKAFIWFIIMLIIAIVMFIAAKGEETVWWIIGICEILMVALAMYLHIFSWIIGIVGLLIFGAIIGKKITDLFT